MFKNYLENRLLANIIEWILSIALALLVFFIVRTFIFRVAQVTGGSMEPTLYHGDMVLLNRFNFLFFDPRPGDIVAFPPYPDDATRFYIKRIIGIPGDVVDLMGGAFYLNGERLDDAFSHDEVIQRGDISFPFMVEYGHYFVLGDNRNGSMDSRFSTVGTVAPDVMVGRVSVRIWPFGRFGRVD